MRGRTLVELLVAITLGVILMGVLIATYLSTGVSSRQVTAISRMDEDAAVALNLISAQLRMAGFSVPRSGVAPASALVDGVQTLPPDRNFMGLGIRACDAGFEKSTVPFDELACASGTSGTAAFSVRYEGAKQDGKDPYQYLLPLNEDCLSQAVKDDQFTMGSLGVAYPLVESRFFVVSGSTRGTADLACAGNGNAALTRQPMVQNVQEMRLRFGVASDDQSSDVVQYLDNAAGVDALGADQVQNWSRVVTVRLCLLMRGAEPGPADAGDRYLDCDGGEVSASDGFLRRAYFTTVALRNRGGIAATAP
ncbi:PilW family protein [Variovorax sp. KK3]